MNRVMLGVSCAVLASAPLAAQEKEVTRAQLPAAVRAVADSVSRGATVRGYSSEVEGGKTQYEVALSVRGKGRDVTLSADGKILLIEDEVALGSLPAAVRNGLKAGAGSGTIGMVESITRGGHVVAYEAHVKTGDKASEVEVDAAGKPVKH